MQIVIHGIAEKLLPNMKTAMDGIFNLTLEEKRRYAIAADDVQAYVTSEDQKLVGVICCF